MILAAEPTTADTFAAARRAMIDSQLRTSGVTAPAVIAAMAALPRERYVPGPARDSAYIDRALPLRDGGALAAPLFHGRLLAEAAIQPAERVLVIENGTAYLTDLAKALAATVTGVSAAVAADLSAASLSGGAFDVILIDGAAEQLPDNLTGLLVEGGRLLTGLADRTVTRLALGRKIGGRISLLPLADIGIPMIAHFARPQGWSF
jgi:protein-L-isoaspartate(D-aspartate) O-methyltransferase